ncbi:hypothetical protein AB1I77_25695 [Bacillus paranthracis]|uniref:hypothetical protein n=1 Tax=Bacillus cereus group TaxID=86661 RepID=UPI0024BDE51A|nr:hypothetical protein [Bacillus cereus]
MPKVDGKYIPFGLATITVGEGAEAIVFDGKNYFQADGGEINISPILGEIKIQDFGDSVYDDIFMGLEGELTIVAGNRDLKVLSLAMGYTENITATSGGAAVGIMDAKIGTSMRSKAKKVTIHPRGMGADKSNDISIYKMAGVSEFNEAYANEQGKNEIKLKMYPRDGADADKPANFFYVGEKDPNATQAG